MSRRRVLRHVPEASREGWGQAKTQSPGQGDNAVRDWCERGVQNKRVEEKQGADAKITVAQKNISLQKLYDVMYNQQTPCFKHHAMTKPTNRSQLMPSSSKSEHEWKQETDAVLDAEVAVAEEP